MTTTINWSAWTMKRTRLISMMFLGLLLVAGTSCSTDNATAPAAAPETTSPELGLFDNGGLLGTGLLKGLLYCRPLPAATKSQSIGPNGGTINVGPHSLVVPRGALSQTITITAEVVSDSVNSVRLLPEGLRFNRGKPARLTLSYANCSLVSRLLPKKIVYTNERLRILDILLSIDNILTQKVSASLEHFSRYAVAY
jgi:hypothetical protein